ncbi:hypothetical protein DL96DRAFT_1630957 [Flagelloscypha sp. PMI_526]|nr:hypothetical protein DL96DRAFT_1630957 [Flagelloscypha sp. PMI_526]
MTLSLPPEIWGTIAFYLPERVLPQFKLVSRMLYNACSDFTVLNLVTSFKQDQREQLDILRERLTFAQSNPSTIKKLRIMPRLRRNLMDNTGQSSKADLLLSRILKPVLSLRRRSQAINTDPISDLGSNNSDNLYPFLHELSKDFCSLLPHLTQVVELSILDPLSGEHDEDWDVAAQLTLSSMFPHLTSLTLNLRSFSGVTKLLQGDHHWVLPHLRTFKLSLRHTLGKDIDFGIHRLLHSSPLLEEVEYHLNIDGPIYLSQFPTTSSNPLLREFKLTACFPSGQPRPAWFINMPFPPLKRGKARQLRVVHINPLPDIEVVLNNLDITRLVELRVDLTSCDGPRSLFRELVHAVSLEVLEVVGIRYLSKFEDVAHMMPTCGLVSLKKLYMGIELDGLDANSLGVLAGKAPNLRTLVLVIQTRKRLWPENVLQTKHQDLIMNLKAPEVMQSLLEWKVWDFGMVCRDWASTTIADFENILWTLSDAIPSIESFYGTGRLEVWPGMEAEVNDDWAGKLWTKTSTRRRI